MANVVAEPSRELRRLALRIDVGCGRFLAARGSWALSTQWESLRHAWSLSNLSLRNAEATVLLAGSDLVMLPAAWATTRAAVEAAGRCLWLIQPSDVWEREARWLALMEEGARLGEREEVRQLSSAAPSSQAMRRFVDAVKAKLPDGVVVPGSPSIQTFLRGEGEALALFYVLASQYVHAAEFGTRQWRDGLGVDAGYGEHVNEIDWHWPLWMSWLAFRVTAVRLMEEQGRQITPDLALVDNQIIEAREAFIASTSSEKPTTARSWS